MNELLAKVLTDESARSQAALELQAAQNAEHGLGWAGDAEMM